MTFILRFQVKIEKLLSTQMKLETFNKVDPIEVYWSGHLPSVWNGKKPTAHSESCGSSTRRVPLKYIAHNLTCRVRTDKLPWQCTLLVFSLNCPVFKQLANDMGEK